MPNQCEIPRYTMTDGEFTHLFVNYSIPSFNNVVVASVFCDSWIEMLYCWMACMYVKVVYLLPLSQSCLHLPLLSKLCAAAKIFSLGKSEPNLTNPLPCYIPPLLHSWGCSCIIHSAPVHYFRPRLCAFPTYLAGVALLRETITIRDR